MRHPPQSGCSAASDVEAQRTAVPSPLLRVCNTSATLGVSYWSGCRRNVSCVVQADQCCTTVACEFQPCLDLVGALLAPLNTPILSISKEAHKAGESNNRGLMGSLCPNIFVHFEACGTIFSKSCNWGGFTGTNLKINQPKTQHAPVKAVGASQRNTAILSPSKCYAQPSTVKSVQTNAYTSIQALSGVTDILQTQHMAFY